MSAIIIARLGDRSKSRLRDRQSESKDDSYLRVKSILNVAELLMPALNEATGTVRYSGTALLVRE